MQAILVVGFFFARTVKTSALPIVPGARHRERDRGAGSQAAAPERLLERDPLLRRLEHHGARLEGASVLARRATADHDRRARRGTRDRQLHQHDVAAEARVVLAEADVQLRERRLDPIAVLVDRVAVDLDRTRLDRRVRVVAVLLAEDAVAVGVHTGVAAGAVLVDPVAGNVGRPGADRGVRVVAVEVVGRAVGVDVDDGDRGVVACHGEVDVVERRLVGALAAVDVVGLVVLGAHVVVAALAEQVVARPAWPITMSFPAPPWMTFGAASPTSVSSPVPPRRSRMATSVSCSPAAPSAPASARLTVTGAAWSA